MSDSLNLTSRIHCFQQAVAEGDFYSALGVARGAKTLDIDLAGTRLGDSAPAYLSEISRVANVLTHRRYRALYDVALDMRDSILNTLATASGNSVQNLSTEFRASIWNQCCHFLRFDLNDLSTSPGPCGAASIKNIGVTRILQDYVQSAEVQKSPERTGSNTNDKSSSGNALPLQSPLPFLNRNSQQVLRQWELFHAEFYRVQNCGEDLTFDAVRKQANRMHRRIGRIARSYSGILGYTWILFPTGIAVGAGMVLSAALQKGSPSGNSSKHSPSQSRVQTFRIPPTEFQIALRQAVRNRQEQDSAEWHTDLQILVPAQTLRSNSVQHTCQSFSPNGRWYATGATNGLVNLYDIQDDHSYDLNVSQSHVTALAFLPDSSRLAVGLESGEMILDISTDDFKQFTSDASAQPGFQPALTAGAPVTWLALTSSGSRMASISGDRNATIWDLDTRQKITDCFSDFPPTCLAYSPDGKWLAIGNQGGSTRLWSADSFSILLPEHCSEVSRVEFSSSGTFLASGSLDGTITIWDVVQREPHVNLYGHRGAVNDICFSNDEKYLVSCSEDGFINLWDVDSGAELFSVKSTAGNASKIKLNSDSTILFSSHPHGELRSWHRTDIPLHRAYQATSEWELHGLLKQLGAIRSK